MWENRSESPTAASFLLFELPLLLALYFPHLLNFQLLQLMLLFLLLLLLLLLLLS